MNSALHIVNRLLAEGAPYDVDDPLEKNDPALYPAGFSAKKPNGDERVFALSLRDSTPQVAVYSMASYWIDEFIGKRRVLDSRRWHTLKPDAAKAWLEAEAARWASHGWEVTWL